MPHLSIRAAAGTGKTTTIVEGSKVALGLGSSLVPSTQQAAVWDAMREIIRPDSSVRFMAFNASIAKELGHRLPSGMQSSTFHSFGFSVLRQAKRSVKLQEDRVGILLNKVFRIDFTKQPELFYGLRDLVSLVKVSLADWHDTETLLDLIDWHSIALNGSTQTALKLLPAVMGHCYDCPDNLIDFDDMVWLPVVRQMTIPQTDVLLVDERQDLNRVQQELCFRAGATLIGVGDPRQAIYGFAGADAGAFQNLSDRLAATSQGLVELPLMQTRRCPKKVVASVKHIVPDFEALPEAPEGVYESGISHNTLLGDKPHPTLGSPQAGDMILCRTNAPLISLCYGLLARDIPAAIQGRKVGTGLQALVKKSKATTIPEFVSWIDRYEQTEMDRLLARKNPSASAQQTLEDKIACLHAMTAGQRSISELVQRIDRLFSDTAKANQIRLSSIHKAKGLEADRVWVACSDKVPTWAKQQWEKEQEANLIYVARTRAKQQLALCLSPAEKGLEAA